MREAKEVLIELVEGRKIDFVLHVFTSTIGRSMDADKAPNTRAEVKRRFDLCLRIFCEMRKDMKWSLQRCLDSLPGALKQELHEGGWKPMRGCVWLPGDGV